RSDRDHEEELVFHLEMLTERHRRRGLDEAAARRAARLELGGADAVVEEWRDQRGLPWLDTLGQDVRYALRTLRRSRGFTAAALITLGLGIGANTAIFSVVDAVLLRPLPYLRSDQLVAVGDAGEDGTPSSMGWMTIREWKERSRTLADVALMRSWSPTLVADGEAERLGAVRVSWNWFDMLGVHPALGRAFEANEDDPQHWHVVMLSD